MDNMIIRTASTDDAAELVDIYRPYVTDTAITFEYEVPSAEEFAERIRRTLERYPYIVASENGNILGYAYTSAYIGRKASEHSVETSIYVRSGFSGKGIGGMLYHRLEKISAAQNITNLNAAIASTAVQDEHLTNASIAFHKHMGYTVVGTFHNCGYKFGKWYDLTWMEKMLSEHTDHPGDIIPFGKTDMV